MQNKKIVLDTNCLLASLSRQGRTYPAWKAFQEGRYILCVTNEILEEYEEIIAQKTTASIAKNVIDLIRVEFYSQGTAGRDGRSHLSG